MDVTVDLCGREGHSDCLVLKRMRHLTETQEPVDLDEVNTLIEWVRARERLLRESRQMLEQRRMRDALSRKMEPKRG
jgi:hypothetical protein